ncbi:MAG: amidase [Microbacteriaceae bacterium]|nr:amidase [Microbacteriaceae bacterium]
MTELHELTAVEQRELLHTGELTAVELADHYLARIAARNDELRAFVVVTGADARARAARLDDGHDRGRHDAPLRGLPFGDKDLVDRAGVPSGYGSLAMTGHVPEVSSPLVATMDAAGGVSLGKTNTPEFGFPSYTENLLPGGVARNPWDTDLGPGGSSGGAAVAVAAGLLPFAPGSDGGGSIRIPAAACGLVGLKPSRGRVPDGSGIDALGGLTVAGPIARTVADAALLLDGMIARGPGGRPADRHALTAPGGEASYLDALQRDVRPLRIGWNTWSPWATHYGIELDAEAEAVLHDTLKLAGRLGHRVVELAPSPFPEYFDAFREVWMGGAASLPLDDEALERVEPLTAWLVRTGRERGAGRLAAALATLARFERSIIADYAEVDVVLTPALAMPPRPIGWYDAEDGERNFEQQCRYTPYTSYVNVAGLPAIAMPVAAHPLPFGVQAIGRPGDEITLLRLAAQLERELDWSAKLPFAR